MEQPVEHLYQLELVTNEHKLSLTGMHVHTLAEPSTFQRVELQVVSEKPLKLRLVLKDKPKAGE
jgi:hypothetical protein